MIKAAILQIHTTGPDLIRDFIIQIGFRPLDNNPTSIVKYFKPGGRINRLALFQSGLSFRQLESKPYFGENLDYWVHLIAQYDYIFYFPGSTVNPEAWYQTKLGLDTNKTRCINLQRLTHLFFPNINESSIDSLYSYLFKRPFPKEKDTMEATLVTAEKELQVIIDRMLSNNHILAPVIRALVRYSAERGNSDMMALHRFAVTSFYSGQMKSYWTIEEKQVSNPKTILNILDTVMNKQDSSLRRKSRQKEKQKQFKPVKPSVLRSFFTTPYLKNEIRNFEKRPQQITYAEQILEIINRGGRLLIEAPTGIGKSIGYLAPLAFFLERNPQNKIVVATATKTLQDQILNRDWPLLSKRFPEIRIASLKGKGNFICWSAFLRVFEVYVMNGNEYEIISWLAILIVVSEADGDLESIPSAIQHWLPFLKEIIHDVRADIHCNARMCAHTECLYQRHLNQAATSQIIITNHHKVTGLPIDIESVVVAIIVDEADRFPDNARNALSNELNSGEILFFIQRQLGSERRRGFLNILGNSLRKKEADFEVAVKQIHSIRLAMKEFKESCLSFRALLVTGTDSFRPPRLIEYPVFKTGRTFENLMQPLLNKAGEIQSILDKLTELNSVPFHLQLRCGGYSREMKEVIAKITALLEGFKAKNTVLHYQEHEKDWSIIATPVYLDQVLGETFYKNSHALVFSSATLFVNGTIKLMSRELGLTAKQNVHSLRISSSFQYKDQVYCGIDTTIPPFSWRRNQPRQEYMNALAQAIIVYTIAANGRSLVLFTSWMDMSKIYRMVAPILQKYDIIPIIQRGSSLYETRLFRDIEYSVLFGVDRFWYGVDFPGRTLSQVIIAKAPNPNLSNPVIRHRLVNEADFMSRTYPALAALRLRQGFGRLIRSRSDRGAVILLDSRYGHNPYHRNHLTELPVPSRLEVQKRTLMKKALISARLWNEFQERRIDPFLESPAEII